MFDNLSFVVLMVMCLTRMQQENASVMWDAVVPWVTGLINITVHTIR